MDDPARRTSIRAVDEDPGPPDVHLDRLIPVLYTELHDMAERLLRREFGEPTLSTTTLLHEAYMKLAAGHEVSERGREYLFAAASRAMRQVLVDHARRRGRSKRGGGMERIRLEEAQLAADGPCADVLEVDRALDRLAGIRPRAAQIVEGRFFGGLGLTELAPVLGISERTAKRDWAFARAWLYRELAGGQARDPGGGVPGGRETDPG